MACKKFDVDTFKTRINAILESSTCSRDTRLGLCTALEYVLFETKSYKGFGYLTVNEVPEGHMPGVRISPIDGQHLENYEARFAECDDSRRYYH